MARIRTIKPEFPQSESMGRVSRDARLLFIMLWTIADDAGRLRGNSRMLASLLFPYDDDAKSLIDGWLAELSGEGCLNVYKVASDTYIEICNWLIHQKIDKPSKSKIQPFDESSRILANPRESSCEDQGSRTRGSEDQVPKDHPSADATDKRTSAKNSARRAEVTVSIPDWIPGDAWQAFVQHRKDIRKPLTAKAAELAIGELWKLKAAGNDPVAVINQSIVSRWAGLFPLKGGSHADQNHGKRTVSLSAPERVAAAIAERDGGRTFEHSPT